AANKVFCGPQSGSDDLPAFRELVPSDLPVATTSSIGAVSVGSGLSVTGGVLSADAPPIATTGSTGVISVGSGLSVTGGGILSANAPAIATTSTPGIVSVGDGLAVTAGGVLSANSPPVATTSSTGVVSVGSGLSITGAGVLSRSTSYSVGVPALSSFTKVNQGTSTVSEVSGSSITMSGVGSAAGTYNNFLLYKAAPSSPYRLAAYLSVGAQAVTYFGGGLAFYDTSTTRFVEVFFCWNVNSVCNIQVSKWSSPTTFNSTPITWGWSMNSAGFWLGLRDDGTNVYYEYSSDGANFVTIYSEPKSSGYLSSYSNVALVTNLSNATSSHMTNTTLFIWDVNGLSRTPSIVG
ncbi:MAG TPA: hypothetical protein VN039_17545, partial [Nitrospira sp.]|nr:hypothetical protein [Nitrospira sp.]